MATLKNVNLTSNSTGVVFPTGTSNDRPTPSSGMFRYNTTNGNLEFYDGEWKGQNSAGIETTVSGSVYSVNVGGYRCDVFYGSGTFTVNAGEGSVEYLIVGGGGGGGMDMGGGGGGGAVRHGSARVSPGDYTITVGDGGYGAPGGGQTRADGVGPNNNYHQFSVSATNGQPSSAFGVTAPGGGYGGSSYYGYTPNYGYGYSGSDIASGGGNSGYSDGNTRPQREGVWNSGYRGGQGGGQYYSGGGGGAGGDGVNSTNRPDGGIGVPNNILGIPYWWGGGGGGASYSRSDGGHGGQGGGGGGAVGESPGGYRGFNNGEPGGRGGSSSQTNTPGGDGGENTGGGGGGGSHYRLNNRGGEGGSGIVIVKYKPNGPVEPPDDYEILFFDGVSGNLTVEGNGTRSVDIWKSSGSYSWDNQAYCSTPFTAPVTLEFNKAASANPNSLDNGDSYAMIGWNEDRDTNASYTSIDYASYPYRQDQYVYYNNGSGSSGHPAWKAQEKFRISYDTDGTLKHWNGTTELVSFNYGTNKTVYIDSSFYSVNKAHGGFYNIRVIKKVWNGTRYV